MNEDLFKRKAVGDARRLTRDYAVRGVIIITFEDGRVAGASYGETKDECRRIGFMLDGLISELQSGPWPWKT